MESVLRFFIQRHLLVNIVAGTLVVLGYLSAVNLNREFVPAIETPLIFVTANLPGASARDMETKITIPIEEALEGLDGIDYFETIVSDSTSYTSVRLYDDFDSAEIEDAETDLRAAVDRITDFPVEMEDEPVLMQLKPGRFTVIEVILSGPEPELSRTAEDLETGCGAWTGSAMSLRSASPIRRCAC